MPSAILVTFMCYLQTIAVVPVESRGVLQFGSTQKVSILIIRIWGCVYLILFSLMHDGGLHFTTGDPIMNYVHFFSWFIWLL